MPSLAYMSLDAWKHAVMAGDAPDDAVLCKTFVDTEMKVHPSERRVRLTLSTKAEDRDRDTIDPVGWHLARYRQNPQVLWAHDYRSLPIGNAVEVTASEARLSAVDQFVERDIYPFADTVYQLLKGGYLHACSVGFRPLKRAFNDDRRGFDFMEQELLEHSIVPVPSNPEALVEARSVLGAELMQPLIAWCEEALDTWHGGKGLWVSREAIEGAWRSLAPVQHASTGVPDDPDDAPVPEQRPFPNEHACRVRDPSAFEPESFRRLQRQANGKRLDIIVGKLQGDEATTLQAYRYPKDAWTVADARQHCQAHDGQQFEPAVTAGIDCDHLDAELCECSTVQGEVFDVNDWVASLHGVDDDHHQIPEMAGVTPERFAELLGLVLAETGTAAVGQVFDDAVRRHVTGLTGRLVD